MNKDDFYDYIRETFDLSGTSLRLIQNILDYIKKTTCNKNEQYSLACDLLDGFGLTDDELKKIEF